MHMVRGGLVETLEVVYGKLMTFLPNFLLAVILLGAGIVIARILRFVFLRFFRAINVDKFWDRAGMREVLNKGGIKQPLSVELSKIIYWLIVIMFVVMSLAALQISVVDMALARFFLYLPNVFVALLILFVGYILSNFFARATLIALVNAGVKQAGLAARLVRIALFAFTVTMTLEQLDIGRQSVLTAFTIVFGGLVLTFAIAFGLGSHRLVRDYLERQRQGDDKKDDIEHI